MSSFLQRPYRGAKALAHHLLEHTGYARFIVLTRSRTGSNMVISCLGSHPAVHVESEIFARLGGKTNEEILNGIFCRRPRRVKAVGFKIFYYHPQDDERKEIWKILQGMEGLRVIHLKRKNVLRTLVSRKIAGERNVWSSIEEKRAASRDKKQIEFTAAELREGFIQTRRWESDYQQMFAGHPILDLCYENLVADLDGEFKRITDFLGLPFHRPHSEFERQNPEPLHALIRNYEELRREFAQSEWSGYFDAQSGDAQSARRGS